MNALKIYKSSAGSGKTFILVKEYLKLVLQNPEDFRHILAITFTNKAAAEMKGRIVEALVGLREKKTDALHDTLTEELPGLNIARQADKALKLILHNYSSFSVSTIDSFFQRILRSLAREMHLPLRLDVEIGLDDAIIEVTDRLLKDVGSDKELTNWLAELMLQKLEEDKGWNVEPDIRLVAEELFKDHYDESKTLSRKRIKEIYDQLKATRLSFEKAMRDCASEALKIMESEGLKVEDFAYGKSGVMGNLSKMSRGFSPDDFRLKARALEALDNPDKWSSKSSAMKENISHAVHKGLGKCLEKANKIFQRDFKTYLSACEALRRIYMFGIVNDLLKKFSEYRNENNVILLADTPRMLSEIITGQDAPFIYEKAGNRYKHLLIDEFQDTSLYQWKNLLPLLNNALGSGNMALVVGDAKQSIYRWRGGNMNLLVYHIFEDLSHFKELYIEEILATNYRSRNDVVSFNNDFFRQMPALIRTSIRDTGHSLIDNAYSEKLIQEIPLKNRDAGYVRVQFLEKENETEEEEALKWKDIALQNTLKDIRALLKNNYRYRDITILVRKNSEGNEIARYLLENGITRIISPDSLLISNTPRIRFLINIMKFLSNPDDSIARTEVMHYFTSAQAGHATANSHELFSDHTKKDKKSSGKESATLFNTEGLEASLFNKLLPEAFTGNISYLGKLPVYDLSEQLVSIFRFDANPDAYIQRFQDLVLEYSASHNSSLDGFLEWWEESNTVQNCSVLVPENEDAIRIMTIHKSKGLQFPVVIMPFADWRIMPKANDLFWAESPEEPYREMGKVAVLISNRLKETSFSDSYEEEIMQTVTDNLNLLYVSFTRAEEQLIVYSPKGSSKDINRVSSLLDQTIRQVGYAIQDGVFERGNPELSHEKIKKQSELRSEKLERYLVSRWQEKIGITGRAKDLLQITGEHIREKISYGILIHRVLSEVEVLPDLEDSVNKIIFEGLIPEEQKAELMKEISDLLKLPELSAFFDAKWEVRNEREIILPGGEMMRPDRVLLGANETIVIDFKTGKRSASHERQINAYADVLRKMDYPHVKSYLLYISEKMLVEI